MHIEDFDYELPTELIAQEPCTTRDESKLMVVNRHKKTIEHKIFKNLIDYLNPEDVLVINNTKVIPARLLGGKENTGARIEFLLLKKIDRNVWITLVKPSRKVELGTIINFDNEILKATIIAKLTKGMHVVKFTCKGKFQKILEEFGKTPLPPYIKRETELPSDRERYQTIYSRYEGSVAAPTAGMHFSQELLKSIQEKGVKLSTVILHVGYGTFSPIEEEKVENHKMYSEFYSLKKNARDIINTAKMNNKNIFAVGTTSARVLETCVLDYGMVKDAEGYTDLFIYPGYEFKIVDRLITNFHLPRSTLLMLVSAFAGRELIIEAYKEAIREKYRFYSFGDAMLII
ncbi:MAG: tRNA preQ1(34) S-adenosylmethionine ribosyltransferase-isomerase QueA [Candidatus Firestonebacteria bacterium]|nr:tRNA preQ1(34) S-adenosylmethionine ribosyltransferase-isomerase QueA [Candidatus Firestonebacteria bacterium]